MLITIDKKIRIEMVKKGIKGAAIARRIGVCRSAINKTITGRIKSHKLRKAIADEIGLPIAELWPEEGKVA
ncbi:MAG: helix-turn-helix domain-containing protein [Nitrospinae bacterium]|nr:helix-turn-helix domain-containing protein [Nitrospinota bacterium]